MCVEALPPDILNDRTFDARDQFNDVFALLSQVKELPNNHSGEAPSAEAKALAQGLQSLLLSDTKKLSDLPVCEKYSRHVIGTQGSWLGLICRWQANMQSSIHGHPSFAYYQVVQGHLAMDLYEPEGETKAKWVESKTMHQGDSLWRHGKPGQYDNLVHKVSNEQADGFTIHLFSENPALGKAYTT